MGFYLEVIKNMSLGNYASAVAQMAEQLTTDLKVKGSNLAVIGDGRKLRKLKFFLKKFEIKNFEWRILIKIKAFRNL
jgi:hypothetical protein